MFISFQFTSMIRFWLSLQLIVELSMRYSIVIAAMSPSSPSNAATVVSNMFMNQFTSSFQRSAYLYTHKKDSFDEVRN